MMRELIAVCAALIIAGAASAQPTGADASRRPLGAYELRDVPAEQLRLIRNEIFARKGYRFQSPDLDVHFRARDWYAPSDAEIELSEIERYNVQLLRLTEQSRAAPGVALADRLAAPTAQYRAIEVRPDGSRIPVQARADRMRFGAEDAAFFRVYADLSGQSYTVMPDGEGGRLGVIDTGYASQNPRFLHPELMAHLNVRVITETAGQIDGERVVVLRVRSYAAPGQAYDEAFYVDEETRAAQEGSAYWSYSFGGLALETLSGHIAVAEDGVVLEMELNGAIFFNEGSEYYFQSVGAAFTLEDVRREPVPATLFERRDEQADFWTAPG